MHAVIASAKLYSTSKRKLKVARGQTMQDNDEIEWCSIDCKIEVQRGDARIADYAWKPVREWQSFRVPSWQYGIENNEIPCVTE